ncbi:hypothetical protein SSCG_03242 [Streptomyces clavuligerus]|nr:hypothetical protein SSCG_03242 [Streptomyces clavuligerus]
MAPDESRIAAAQLPPRGRGGGAAGDRGATPARAGRMTPTRSPLSRSGSDPRAGGADA